MLWVLALCPGVVERAAAVELRLQFGALERMLTEQLFTQEGRGYVHGSKTTKCDFAYLERPQIRGEDGKLRITARFTGRKALNLVGQCVGLGDAFDVVITAIPQYKSGNIGLQEVKVASAGRSGFYIRRVCEAMQATLARDFRYPIEADAHRILEDPRSQPGYQRDLKNFKVPEIRVSGDALVLSLDFELTVK
ncbi:MAG TPA: hypothetical protein VNY05_20900 [Candidatus Acidoferrales bacterium]|nr:hypothetical protein [Candidatus Acidoferrales bacterium]